MKARARNQAGKALTAEFAVALTVFLLVTLFPLINLIGFAMGAGTQYLMTVQCAGGAGASTTWNDALSAMDREAVIFANSGFGKFANLQPVGGHNNTGTDLYLIETSLAGNNVLSYGPNTGGPAALNSNNNVYEYQVRSTFDVGPFVNMSQMPWIGNVPGVGRPARLSFVAHRNCEFTDDLAMGATGVPIVAVAGGGGGGYNTLNTLNTLSTGGGGGGGPTTIITGSSTPGSTTIIAASRFSNFFNGGGGGGSNNNRRRRGNNNTASIASSGSGTTQQQKQQQNFNTTSTQSQSGSYSTTLNGQTNSGSVTQTATNSNTNGSPSQNTTNPQTGPTTGITGTTTNTINNPTPSADGSVASNSSSYSYTNNVGPVTIGGVVVSSSQSGSGTQNQSSSVATH